MFLSRQPFAAPGLTSPLPRLASRPPPQFHGSSNTDQLVRIARVLGSEGLHDYLETYDIALPQEYSGLIPRGAGWKAKPWSKFVNADNERWISADAVQFLDVLLKCVLPALPCPRSPLAFVAVRADPASHRACAPCRYDHQERATAKEAQAMPYFDPVHAAAAAGQDLCS